jgi:hypothetical protein
MSDKNFIFALETSLADNSFVKLSLGHYKGPDNSLKNIYVRKILVKREEKLSFTYRHKTNDIVKNYDISEALEKITAELKKNFHAATLFTTQFDLQFEHNKLKKNPPSQTTTPNLAHNREKNRVVATEGKSWLHALGITDDKGNVLKTAQDKYRQIDKYVEILSGLIKSLPQEKIKNIVDMGAGKGYLTFALYDYLVSAQKLDVKVTGVEMRPDLVRLCNAIAGDANFSGLNFAEGTIQNYDASSADLLIALHACDTATDDAIHKGIAAGAKLIVVAPCCHKQIRREMESTTAPNELSPLTRHGIFMERQAEMVTDAIRALALEHFGYTVKVFEFISDAHTPKNVMITATKTGKKSPEALEKIREIKDYFGIRAHALEGLVDLS